MTGERLLLVSPDFHGYWASLARAFERLGYAVVTHRYDTHGTLRDKVRHKVGVELPTRLGLGPSPHLGQERTSAAVAALAEVDPDVVLVVKGDTLGPTWWSALLEHRARRALWLYDELRRTEHTPQTLAAAGPVASYSPEDVATLAAQGLHTAYVPLAHDPDIAVHPHPADEVVFVGARYAARERLLGELAAAGVPVRAYGRDWSGHPVDRLRTWRVGSPDLPSGRDLSRADAYGVMAGAAACLNVHGDQDGFTMRTFEASGVGALQLIDRADVAGLYEPGTEVAVFASPEEAAELALRARTDPGWGRSIREAARSRTLAAHTFQHRARALADLWEVA